MTSQLTRSDIARWRLHTMGLVGPGFVSPADVVATLGAVQAQDHAIALWSVAQRVPSATVTDVQRLLDDGELLRTHVLRPTWHYVTPADIGWMLELTAPRIHVHNGTYYRRHGFDDEVFARAHDRIRAALSDGAHRTRAALAEELAAGGIDVTGQALEHLVMHAELEGVICSGRMRGRQQTYALLEDRAPARGANQRTSQRVAELTLRYFTGHGPATVQDFRWWSSLTMRQIEAGLQQVGDRLYPETVDDRTYLAAGPPPPGTTSPTDGSVIRLLQSFDEYVVGYRDSRDVIDLSGAEAERRGTPGLPSALVIVDGQIAGRWRRRVRAAQVDVEVALHRPFDEAEAVALQAEVDRYAAALGRSATLITSTV